MAVTTTRRMIVALLVLAGSLGASACTITPGDPIARTGDASPSPTSNPTIEPIDQPTNSAASVPDAGAPTRLVEIFVYSSARAEEVGIAGTPESVIPLTRRIPVTTTPIKDTIELLLSDPLTDAERAAGYFTNFPHEGFVLEDINLEPDGTLILRFPDLPGFTTGGSAHTSVLQATIERTALQFDEVERVEGFTFSP